MKLLENIYIPNGALAIPYYSLSYNFLLYRNIQLLSLYISLPFSDLIGFCHILNIDEILVTVS